MGHLPSLGLPARWEQTAEKAHQFIAFRPDTKETIKILSKKVIPHKKSPAGFLTATHMGEEIGKMMGTDQPASARLALFLDKNFQEMVVEGAEGETLVPCLAHGDYVDVRALENDRSHAKQRIYVA